MAVQITAACLDPFVGLGIWEICPLKFGTKGDSHNHCAHFVSHVLQLNHATVPGTTCAAMSTSGGKHPTAGGCIRVNEIYNHCDKLDKPDEAGCLAYATVESNFERDGRMGSMLNKHIGIYFAGKIWDYHNTADEVGTDVMDRWNNWYGKGTVTRFTKFPAQAKLLTLAEIQALAK